MVVFCGSYLFLLVFFIELIWFFWLLSLHHNVPLYLQGERNFNRFGGWLGKNSTMGKNLRLMDDLHVHILASRESSSGR